MAESSVEVCRPLLPTGLVCDPRRYDARVTNTPPDGPQPAQGPRAAQGPTPGERRLAHPPSDRYRAVEPEVAPEPVGSMARGVLLGLGSAAAGDVAITVLGGVLAVSAGLIVVAAATGWATGLCVRVGARGSLSQSRRIRMAVGLAIGAVAVGQFGLWLYARSEGGVLGPFDYLGETFGLLVPLEVLGAAVAAWVSAR
jgi:hypothetical protein